MFFFKEMLSTECPSFHIGLDALLNRCIEKKTSSKNDFLNSIFIVPVRPHRSDRFHSWTPTTDTRGDIEHILWPVDTPTGLPASQKPWQNTVELTLTQMKYTRVCIVDPNHMQKVCFALFCYACTVSCYWIYTMYLYICFRHCDNLWLNLIMIF